jgi:hypothetical protein
LIPGGEIRAGVRTPNILIGKISFPIQQEIKPQRH